MGCGCITEFALGTAHVEDQLFRTPQRVRSKRATRLGFRSRGRPGLRGQFLTEGFGGLSPRQHSVPSLEPNAVRIAIRFPALLYASLARKLPIPSVVRSDEQVNVAPTCLDISRPGAAKLRQRL